MSSQSRLSAPPTLNSRAFGPPPSKRSEYRLAGLPESRIIQPMPGRRREATKPEISPWPSGHPGDRFGLGRASRSRTGLALGSGGREPVMDATAVS